MTGASSGLGVAFAHRLAARGADVVLVARRIARLEELAERLREDHGVSATALACDLADPDAAAALTERLDELDLPIDVLVNNAGAGVHELFAASEWEPQRDQIQVNVTSLVELAHRIGVRMAERGGGHILNVASVGAYLPVPGFATYAASKSFVRSFSEAIAAELAPRGVRVCCMSPGGIDTEFFQAAGQPVPGWMRLFLMSPDRCARIGLSALFGCRRDIVSGWSNALGMFALRFIPRWFSVLIAGALMGKRAAPPRLVASGPTS